MVSDDEADDGTEHDGVNSWYPFCWQGLAKELASARFSDSGVSLVDGEFLDYRADRDAEFITLAVCVKRSLQSPVKER